MNGKTSEAGRFRVTSAMTELSEKQLNLFGSTRNPRWKTKLKNAKSWTFPRDISDARVERDTAATNGFYSNSAMEERIEQTSETGGFHVTSAMNELTEKH